MSQVRAMPCSSCGERPARQPSGLCVQCYQRKWRTGSTDPSTRTKPGEPMRFFLAHVDDETDECIIWPFGKDQDGYGVVPRNRRAHVLACTAHHGSRPPGKEVAHSCDNAACFNHRHLRWATHQENEDEKSSRGRRPGVRRKGL